MRVIFISRTVKVFDWPMHVLLKATLVVFKDTIPINARFVDIKWTTVASRQLRPFHSNCWKSLDGQSLGALRRSH